MKYPWPLPPPTQRCRWYDMLRDGTLTGTWSEGRCDMYLQQSNKLANVICIEEGISRHQWWGYGDYRGEPFTL